jgi:hypothetical protein
VKRVVYTSSEAAVLLNGDQEVDEMDESFWSDVDLLRASKPFGHLSSYMISKTLTERAALEFAEKHGLDASRNLNSFLCCWTLHLSKVSKLSSHDVVYGLGYVFITLLYICQVLLLT